MKIKLIRSDLGVAAGYDLPEYADQIDHEAKPPLWKSGAVVAVPDAWSAQILVDNGDAEPADDEAESACTGWKLRRDDVLLSREMLAKSIDPDDRDKFRRGEILGYDESGDYIPGPNWTEPEEESDE